MITVISSFFNESKNCELFFNMVEECSLLIPISQIVVVDNGSKDDTYYKLKKFKSDNFQIKVLQNPPNSKYGDGFHNAFKNATNEYIITLHSDLQFNLKEYVSSNLDVINKCIRSNTNIFPQRYKRSFTSVIRTIIFKIIISILYFRIFDDFNGQPKLLIKNHFIDLRDHCPGFGYDLTLYFFLKKNKKKIDISTKVIEKNRIHGKTSWNKQFLPSVKILFDVLKN